MTIFGELDHRLSVVKRWGILHTIQTQSVAEHAFNVERIARRIAERWFAGMKPHQHDEVSQWALHHDDLESLMGDPPTMIKPYFDEFAMIADHADLIPVRTPDSLVRAIVKLADLLEGFHFVCTELKLGNSFAETHIDNYYLEVEKHILKNGLAVGSLVEKEMRHIRHYSSTRHSRKGR